MTGPIKVHIIPLILLATFVSTIGTGSTDEKRPVEPSRKDKCPVCGMFVYKYPDWLAQVTFKNGSVQFFDGTKDLFKYYFNLRKYSPAKTRRDIETIFVKEYYELEFLDARKAFFVLGSDVLGPMGHELIPLASLEDAGTFMKDHKGRRILSFGEVTRDVMGTLD